MSKKINTSKEVMAKFLEAPTREGLRGFLQDNLGEFSHTDFKEAWPEPAKIARHVLGLANSGGGALILGVSEKPDKTLDPVGMKEMVDKVEVGKSFHKFLPHSLIQNIEILDFSYDTAEYSKLNGKNFQVLLVADEPEQIPFLPINETTGLKKTAVYVRRLASTEEATYEELQDVINRRLKTGHSTETMLNLLDHMEHLKTLYSYLEKHHLRYPAFDPLLNIPRLMGAVQEANKEYPKEDYEAFIVRMIDEKKKVIERHLGIRSS